MKKLLLSFVINPALLLCILLSGSLSCSGQHKQGTSSPVTPSPASARASQVPTAPENRDADIEVGATRILVQGTLQRDAKSRYSSWESAVVVECDKEWENGECLWIVGDVNDKGKPHVGIEEFKVIRWTDEEVIAEPAGMGHVCYTEMVQIKLAKPFRGEFPSKGVTTFARTPKTAVTDDTRKACESVYEMKPEIERVVWSPSQN